MSAPNEEEIIASAEGALNDSDLPALAKMADALAKVLPARNVPGGTEIIGDAGDALFGAYEESRDQTYLVAAITIAKGAVEKNPTTPLQLWGTQAILGTERNLSDVPLRRSALEAIVKHAQMIPEDHSRAAARLETLNKEYPQQPQGRKWSFRRLFGLGDE